MTPETVRLLLGREPVTVDPAWLDAYVCERRFVVTGAAGSIGSELCRRLIAHRAKDVVAIDHHEPSLYALDQALDGGRALTCRLGDVRDRDRLFELFALYQPDVVIHAAALKHVPILEGNWGDAIKTNVLGTMNVYAAVQAFAPPHARLIVISTDKAVAPVSVLGVTKRMAELVCAPHPGATAVRFGNVLGSSGSVLPKFLDQIRRGGPVTVTDKAASRYFMSATEACDLVLAAAATRDRHPLYMLRAGEPVAIDTIARRLIDQHMLDIGGYRPEIVYTGLRPGERLTERLIGPGEATVATVVPGLFGIRRATDAPAPKLPERREIEAIETRKQLMWMLGCTA